MKKFLSLLLVFLFAAASALAVEPANVLVTITDDTGAIVLACRSVAVTDADEDGALTINDALLCAHTDNNENGAEAYQSENTEYGLSLTRLWGVENGGSYGYYVNDASAWSLLDPVKEGDHVKAFVYTDLTAWSDTYTFFNAPMLTVKASEAAELVLSAAGFDESYAPITLAVEGAAITVNGEATELVTNAEGKVSLTLNGAGVYTISATSAAMTMVAPVCIITVE